jgi:hypothetical protein
MSSKQRNEPLNLADPAAAFSANPNDMSSSQVWLTIISSSLLLASAQVLCLLQF